MYSIAGGLITTQFVDITNIPQNFAHLQLRIYGRNTTVNNNEYVAIYTSASQSGHIFEGNGTGPSVTHATGSFGYGMGTFPGANSAVNVFGNIIVDIYDYSSTNKTKVMRSICGYTNASSAGIARYSSSFTPGVNTAMTSLTFFAGSTWHVNSRWELYGIESSPRTGA
jgi:hypothetical protein